MCLFAFFGSWGYIIFVHSCVPLSFAAASSPCRDSLRFSQDFTEWLEWMNSPVDDPKKGWLSWYSRVLEETRHDLPFGKKIQAVIRRAR